MTIESLLRFLTQAIFLFVAASTVLNWAKYRGQARFDTALVFLSLAFAILAQDLQPLFPALETVLGLIFFIALLIQPYLLLRLVKYFVVIPTVLQRAALIGLFFVFASFSFIQLTAIPVVILAVFYFLVLEGYATLLLVRGAGTLRGIIGRRLRLAAIGSGLLALIFFLALALVIIRTATRLPPDAQTWLGPLLQILAILSGLSYYFGFSPPRWLRQNWQFKELHRFLQQTSKQLEHNRLTVLEELAAAALRTVGGATAIIASWNATEKRLVIEIPGEIPLQTESLESDTGAIGQTWQDKKPRLAHVPHEIESGTKHWADQFGIRTLFLIPIIGSLQPRGLLMVALRYEPLFIQDDLELLTLLAGEAASSLDRFALLDELQVANQSLEQRVAERTSQLEAEMAERKQAEGQIRYQADLLQNVSDAVVATDPDFNITSWNRAAEMLYGWQAEEVIGKPSREILQTEYLDETEESTRDRLLQKGLWKGEVIQKRRDGTSLNILTSVALVNAGTGKIIGVVAVNRDITERKQAEEQLRYQAYLLENVNDAIVAADANYVIKVWNQAAEKMYGWTAEEMLGQIGITFLQTEFPGVEANEIRRQTAETGHYYGEATQLRKDSTRIPVEIASIALRNEVGQITDFVSVIRDITRRKQAEERFHLAVESAPNAIILADQAGSIVMVNSQTENFFGYRRSELVGLNVDNLVPERYRDIHLSHRQGFLADPQTRSMGVGRDLYGVRKDGSEFPIEIGLTPLETQEGLLVMATVVDITERKQAEERFHLAVESAPNAIALVNREGRINLVNSQAEKFFGYHRSELIGLNVDRLVPERFRPKHSAYRAGFMADPQVRSMGIGRDLWALRKDGSEFPVEIGLTPIETREGLLVMATVVDITARKQAEEKLQWQNQRLKVLREIDTSILASDSVENIVSAALNHIRELIHCERANLALIEWEKNEAVNFDVRDAKESAVPKGARVSLDLIQDILHVLSTNQPVIIDDLTTLPDPPPQIKIFIQEGLRSRCILPLFSQGNLIGSFTLSSKIPGYFDEEKINLGREVANQVAIAITQNNLLNTLRQFNAELEQRVAERTAELSEANTLLQAMLDNIPDQIYFKDLQSRFIRNSRSQAELMGVNDPAEVIGKSDFDFFPHAQRSFDEEQELMKTAQSIVDLEERVAWPDGRVMWVSTTKVPLRNLEGQTIGILGISRDITERKHFEENIQKLNEDLKQYAAQLEESEEKFSKAFLASPAAMSIAQATDGRYMDVNEALARMTGYSREELIGRTSLELGLVDNEAREKILQSGKERGFIRDVEIQVHTRSNQILDVLVSLEQIVLNGQICMLTIQYDITERKRAEAEVRRLNQELEHSQKDIQRILDSMATLNAKVALDGILVFVNKIAIQATGLPYDELLKTNFLEGPWWAFDMQVQSRVKEAFARACSGATVNYDEKIFVFGRVLTINFSLTPMLGNDGAVEYVLAEGRDITILKQLNEELEQRRIALEATNKELETFSYSVSHDLRAPLRAVSGFSQALSGKYSDQLGEQGKHFLDRIQHNTHQMGQLIDDLLSLSRISRREMKQEVVKLSELVREIVAELHAQEPEREVRFEIEEQLEAQGDAGLIRIVLQNLLANAWKFTATRSEAHIQFGQIHTSDAMTSEVPVYYVRDNGVGFDMAFANKLFGAFQRLHSVEEFPGTGIGLATVQRIIHRHGGRIWVEAELEKGATFYFTLGEKHEI